MKNQQYFYSPSNNAFFNPDWKNEYDFSGSWPDDCTEITERWYEYLFAGQASGKVITANEYGQPVLSDPAPLTHDELITRATQKRDELMQAASLRITALVEAQDDGDITDNEVVELASLRVQRTVLRRLDLTNAPDIDWPEMPA